MSAQSDLGYLALISWDKCPGCIKFHQAIEPGLISSIQSLYPGLKYVNINLPGNKGMGDYVDGYKALFDARPFVQFPTLVYSPYHPSEARDLTFYTGGSLSLSKILDWLRSVLPQSTLTRSSRQSAPQVDYYRGGQMLSQTSPFSSSSFSTPQSSFASPQLAFSAPQSSFSSSSSMFSASGSNGGLTPMNGNVNNGATLPGSLNSSSQFNTQLYAQQPASSVFGQASQQPFSGGTYGFNGYY